MNDLAVNAAEGTFCPVSDIGSQSVYEYFAGNKPPKTKIKTNGVCFIAQNGELQRPYRMFNRSLEENPRYPYFRMMSRSNSLLTAWHSQSDKEPTEFELLSLNDMSHENIAWLRAAGELTHLAVNKSEKLLAMAYHDYGWRIDVRRSDNFQLREVVHHTEPIIGLFFHNDVLFSLSSKLVVSYPEDRLENSLIASSKKILGWVQHPTAPYLLVIEPERYWIVDLNKLRVVKKAEWTEQIKWFNILQKYSNRNLELYSNNSIATFSKDGNRLFLGGYGKLAMFAWHDMLRPRCMQPKPDSVINIHSGNYPAGGQKKVPDAHIIDMIPINRDRLLCVSADGYLSMINTRTREGCLLLIPGSGVRINSLQLCAKGKNLAMTGYYYDLDDCGIYKMESVLLIWKLSRLLNKGIKM